MRFPAVTSQHIHNNEKRLFTFMSEAYRSSSTLHLTNTVHTQPETVGCDKIKLYPRLYWRTLRNLFIVRLGKRSTATKRRKPAQ